MNRADVGLTVRGAAKVYRLFDVGYQIDMERAHSLLAPSAPARVRPVRGEAQALQIQNPPITVGLGTDRLTINGADYDSEISARIFDFGVFSMRARVEAPGALDWASFSVFGTAVDGTAAVAECLDRHARSLAERIGSAIERQGFAPVREDYVVYRLFDIRDARGNVPPAEVLSDEDVVALLLNESRPLSANARQELLPHRFSYYADDLAILTWENALIVDTASGDSDVEFILEFANAQLLELRYYDAVLDAELPKLYDRIERARFGPRSIFRRRYARLLGEMHSLVADSTELVERVENSLKVTDDVYLARVYSAALELFRGRVWRAGIDRKLAIIRDTYGMLNAEGQAARAETLELAIIALIVLEIVIALVK